MMENKFFENLVFDLEHSGLLLNIGEALQSGGEAWIEHNLDVKKEIFEKLKNDEKKSQNLLKENKQDLIEKYETTTLYKLLSFWVGNKLIVRRLCYRITKFLSEYDYEVYTYMNAWKRSDRMYDELFNEVAIETFVIIFESKKKVVSIASHWSD